MPNGNGTTTIVKPDEFAIMRTNMAEVREAFAENFGADEGLTRFDLERIRVPSGGALSFEIMGTTEVEPRKHINAIIIGGKQGRRYYKDTFGEGEKGAPDCFSDDMDTGIGNPGGNCQQCPFSQWGTANKGKGKGQACQTRYLLFVFTPDAILPIVVDLPPASLGNYRKYRALLTTYGQRLSSVLTRLGLEAAINASGIKYARMTFSRCGALEKETSDQLKAIADSFVPHLTRVSQADMTDDGASANGACDSDNLPG